MKISQVNLDLIGEAKSRDIPGTAHIQTENIGSGFGPLVGSLLSFAMVIAALLVLFYLLWGGFEWITSGGDSGKTQKARERMTGAVIGIVVLSAVTAVFIIVQQFLGISIFTFAGSTAGGGGGGSAQNTCVINNSQINDGGAGNYCTQGAAMVKCMGPDGHLNYNHYDPCSCVDGAQYQRPGYDFSGC